jgi:hypothetical protein
MTSPISSNFRSPRVRKLCTICILCNCHSFIVKQQVPGMAGLIDDPREEVGWRAFQRAVGDLRGLRKRTAELNAARSMLFRGRSCCGHDDAGGPLDLGPIAFCAPQRTVSWNPRVTSYTLCWNNKVAVVHPGSLLNRCPWQLCHATGSLALPAEQ